MKRLIFAVALAVVSAVGFATSASAGVQACRSVQVNVNGQSVVNDGGCTNLP